MSGSNPIEQNRDDITAKAVADRNVFLESIKEQRQTLKETHQREKLDLSTKHGNTLSRIIKNSNVEHPMITEKRMRNCQKAYEEERDGLTVAHERIELVQETKFKKSFETKFPGQKYASPECDRLLKDREHRHAGKDDPQAQREIEHDTLVKAYMQDEKQHPDFVRDYRELHWRHVLQSGPNHNKQLEIEMPDIEDD
ncbi:MAG: hypothetical protein RLP14_10360 [Owenweeksia sp.]